MTYIYNVKFDILIKKFSLKIYLQIKKFAVFKLLRVWPVWVNITMILKQTNKAV